MAYKSKYNGVARGFTDGKILVNNEDDCVGKTLYDLTLLAVQNRSSLKGDWNYICVCSCGNFCVKSRRGLAKGDSRHCGCKTGKNIANTVGFGWEKNALRVTTKFTHYYVMDYADGRFCGSWKWWCSICGEKFTMTPNHLMRPDPIYYSCSCQHIVREDAVEVMEGIHRVCSDTNTTFIGWKEVIYKGRTASKIIIECPTHKIQKEVSVTSHINHKAGMACCSGNAFSPLRSAHFYVIKAVSENDSFCGYGISTRLKERIAVHKKNLKRNNYTLDEYEEFYFPKGCDADDLETRIMEKFPIYPTPVLGFKTEATHTYNYLDVIAFAEEYQAKLANSLQPTDIRDSIDQLPNIESDE